MVFKIYFLLPVALLVIGTFFGSRPWKYAILTLTMWWGAAVIIFAHVPFEHMLIQGLAFVLMVIAGPMIPAIVGLSIAPVVRPSPADYAFEAADEAYRAYEGLSPERKAQVHQAAQMTARFACKQAGKYFRQQRKYMCADAFNELGKAL